MNCNPFFTNQVAKWETNPVDTIIQYIQLRGESEVRSVTS